MLDAAHWATRLVGCLDLTSLGEHDTPAMIESLCERALTPAGSPAAVCVYPEHVTTAVRALDRLGLGTVAIATVVNFPDGGEDPARAERECQRAIAAGATEIDAVLPHRALLRGDEATYVAVANACRKACGSVLLKTILETGELGSAERIARASRLALDAGTDMLKTSTGKVPVNATLAAAAVMLQAIADSGTTCGFKAAGGIRSLEDAIAYAELVTTTLGPDALRPDRFRLGASTLLDALLQQLPRG